MSNAIVELKKEIASPVTAAQLKMALPEHISVERFQRVALTAIMNNPDLASCTKQSVMTSLIKCATDGLVPDNREAALVKYGAVAQYMPMVYGLIKRMRNSGEISTINAHIAYEYDKFKIVLGDEERIDHEPALAQDRGKPIFAYAIARLKDGGIHREWMSLSDIEKARNAGKAAQGPAWKNWWDEMAKKTVIHRIAKRVPTSSDLEKFMQRDMKTSLLGIPEDDVIDNEDQNSIIDNLNSALEDSGAGDFDKVEQEKEKIT